MKSIAAVSASLLLSLPLPVAARSVLDDIAETGELRIGIQENAIPFGYRDNNRNLLGYCIAFAELLRDDLQDRLDSSILPLVKLVPSTVDTRFDLIRSGRIHLECGPNTIRDDLDGVTFSDPFFLTGVRLLVHEATRERVENTDSWEGLRIGVLENTAAERMLLDLHPEANVVIFRGSSATAQGVSSLQGTLDGFADDEVLLLGEMVKLQLSLSEYVMVPEHPVTCELYGMILPDDDREWSEFVNEIIHSDRADDLLVTWFQGLTDYILPTIEYCTERLAQDSENTTR
ncbi:MAG: transporter substrate-binding domain-containing protein [Cyanobacteria bacterium SBC]|nr:transporter substrate-binding domain-containing protein [Cyanobacteria bacterium SBC]